MRHNPTRQTRQPEFSLTDIPVTDPETKRSDRASTGRGAGLALTIREILTPVFYHWRVALLAFLIPLALALTAVAIAKPMFTAESRLLILLGDAYVFRDTTGAPVANQTFDRSQIVHAEMEILGARDVREEMLNAVGVDKVYPGLPAGRRGMDQALQNLSHDLSIENLPQSNTIEVKFRNRNPVVASTVVNKLVELYIVTRREVFQRADVTTVTGQQRDLKDQLAGFESQLAALANQYNIGDYDQELAAVQQQQAALTTQLSQQDQLIANASGRSSRLADQMRTAPATIELNNDQARSQRVEALTNALTALQERRRVAGARFNDDYPLVVELDRQIAEAEATLAATPQSQTELVRRGSNPVRQQIETQLATARSDLAGLQSGRGEIARALGQANARLASLVQIGPQYRDLVRSRTLAETAYRGVSENAQDTRLQTSLAGANANVRVIEAAQPPAKGKTGRLLILAAGLVFGLIAALAVIMIAAAASPVMVTPRDVEAKLSLPVLSTVPMGPAHPARTPKWRPLPGRMNADDANLVLRRLRGESDSAAGSQGGGVLALLAPNDGEGVTSLALDLAITAAQRSGQRVLLIDVEPLEEGGLALQLMKGRAALGDVSENPRVLRVNDTNLYVTMPMCRPGSNVPEAKWVSFINEVKALFPLIIIDAPAVSRSSSGLLVAPLADMTVMVVEAEATRSAVANSLIERLGSAGGGVDGVIFNKRRFYIPGFIYSRI